MTGGQGARLGGRSGRSAPSISPSTSAATWIEAELDGPVNAGAWQNWRASLAFPGPGYYEIWARATDSEGVGQPHAIAWNPKGYLNNAMHRVAVTVG